MTITLDKKYQTRDGKPVRILCVDANLAGGYSVVGLLTWRDGEESMEMWAADGGYYSPGHRVNEDDDSQDLIEVAQ